MEQPRDLVVDVDDTCRTPQGSIWPGADAAFRALQAAGYRIILVTAQTDPDALREMKEWLASSGLVFDEFQSNKKPPALAYVDNRAIEFRGSWDDVVARLVSGPGVLPPPKVGQLHMLVGLPGSGKSTFSHRLSEQGCLRVAHDAFVFSLKKAGVGEDDVQRLATVAEMAVVQDALQMGRAVTLDRLNLTAQHRARWIGLARHLGAPVTAYHWALGLERQWMGNLARGTDKHVKLDAFREMDDTFEPPRATEGFRAVYDVIEDASGFRELRLSYL